MQLEEQGLFWLARVEVLPKFIKSAPFHPYSKDAVPLPDLRLRPPTPAQLSAADPLHRGLSTQLSPLFINSTPNPRPVAKRYVSGPHREGPYYPPPPPHPTGRDF